MVPNIYILEKLAHEHRQTLLCEAEQKRLLAEVQHAPPPSLQRLAARRSKLCELFGKSAQELGLTWDESAESLALFPLCPICLDNTVDNHHKFQYVCIR